MARYKCSACIVAANHGSQQSNTNNPQHEQHMPDLDNDDCKTHEIIFPKEQDNNNDANPYEWLQQMQMRGDGILVEAASSKFLTRGCHDANHDNMNTNNTV